VSVDELHDYLVEQLQTAASGMSPQRYVVQGDGEKIRLAKAIVSDPEREYRKLVKEKCVRTGSILPAGRRILDQERDRLQSLGLTTARALEIEAEALEPYRKRLDNQKIYRETLEEILALDLSERVHAFEEVNELEERLKLSSETMEQIRLEILGSTKLPEKSKYNTEEFVETQAVVESQEIDASIRINSDSNWRVGDHAVHPSFGTGEVTHVFGSGPKMCLAISFSGEQQIIAPFSIYLKKVMPEGNVQPPAILKQPNPIIKSHVISNWRVGDHIVHPSFGTGEVTHVFGSGPKKICLAINFPSGQKIIDPKLVPLKKI
jgi:hypothetical protein